MDEQDGTTTRFKTFGFAAAWAATLTLLCVVVGQTAEQFALSVTPSTGQIAAATPQTSAKTPVFNAIDYATTGAIKGQTVVLAPCAR